MSLERVRRTLLDRLDEGNRGDRGWFVVTRVHVAVSWLKGIAEYLENRGGGGGVIRLTGHDYRSLARIIGTEVRDPGVLLRRHHLLIMEKPLQLLQRVNGRNWAEIVLTDRGRNLAYTDDPATVLEKSLCAIRFAVEPWTPPNRIRQYDGFDLRVYQVTKQILRRCDGYIDRTNLTSSFHAYAAAAKLPPQPPQSRLIARFHLRNRIRFTRRSATGYPETRNIRTGAMSDCTLSRYSHSEQAWCAMERNSC